jgi:hypothetical protein
MNRFSPGGLVYVITNISKDREITIEEVDDAGHVITDGINITIPEANFRKTYKECNVDGYDIRKPIQTPEYIAKMRNSV